MGGLKIKKNTKLEKPKMHLSLLNICLLIREMICGEYTRGHPVCKSDKQDPLGF